jgi:O6-methylguanine-DNA--protein-cysteine methyltransferase
MTRCFTQIESPLGPLLLVADEAGLREIRFVNGRYPTAPEPSWKEDRAPLSKTIQQLQTYFAGGLENFDLQLAPEEHHSNSKFGAASAISLMARPSPMVNWRAESEIRKHPEPWASPTGPTRSR